MTVDRLAELSSADVNQVLGLAQAADDTDGAPPLSEHVVLHLRHGAETPAVHLLTRDTLGAVVGFAHVDVADPAAGASAELVVHPLHRRHGLGRALATAAVSVAEERSGGRLRVWAHGDHPSASALALRLGFDRARVLLQLRRALPVPDEAVLPDGVSLRAFRPGVDDAEWLAVNAAAFAAHPEQGRWTAEDLRARMAEPWFDPAGFLLAVRDGRIVGFHWTKVHAPAGSTPLGEVYVLGVSPSAHGGGLGRALTLAGLHHLYGRGLTQAALYVDEDNKAAMSLYRRLGFARWSNDVSFQRVR